MPSDSNPIITKQCPECENSQSYHEQSDCEYDETPPDEWSNGLVGFKANLCVRRLPDRGRTTTRARNRGHGDAQDLVPVPSARRTILDVEVQSPSTLLTGEHGSAKGVCKYRSKRGSSPSRRGESPPESGRSAVTLIHEYAHALLHSDVDDATGAVET